MPTGYYRVYRLIACTLLVPKSGAINELAIHEQQSIDGGAAAQHQVVLGGGGYGRCGFCVVVQKSYVTWVPITRTFLTRLGCCRCTNISGAKNMTDL